MADHGSVGQGLLYRSPANLMVGVRWGLQAEVVDWGRPDKCEEHQDQTGHLHNAPTHPEDPPGFGTGTDGVNEPSGVP